ncbi:Platinum sensitivity protein [Linnemannia schmuckeri]|uniref:Platinum sensitivity protein n=1 Tax=Linnemannia schmuckeri TaxID=64567 RepID=A0A9P5S2P4_9FUNG|nr:Platinum sensitivity protein [Linnemannia schmuckeri]
MTAYSVPMSNRDLASTKHDFVDDGPSVTIYVDGYYTSDDESSSNDEPSSGDDDDRNMEVQQELNKYIVEGKYINKLVALLLTCEKSKKTSSLPTLRSIILHLMNRYDSNIIKEMQKNSNFVGCLGILTHKQHLLPLATLDDPNLKEGKAQYRYIFHRVGKCKEVVPINDPHIMKLINQVIHLQFLKNNVPSDILRSDAESLLTLMIKVKTLELV